MTSVVTIILQQHIVNRESHVDCWHFSVGITDEESSALHDCSKHTVDSILRNILWLHLDDLFLLMFEFPPNFQGVVQGKVIGEWTLHIDSSTFLKQTLQMTINFGNILNPQNLMFGMWRLGFVFSLVIRVISSDILTWSSALTWHTYTPVTCHASRVTCNIVTYPRVWAAADQSWGHRRWAHSVLDAGTGGCSYHCRASCMPRLVRRKEERGNVILINVEL